MKPSYKRLAGLMLGGVGMIAMAAGELAFTSNAKAAMDTGVGIVRPASTPVARLDAAHTLAEWALERGDAVTLIAIARLGFALEGSSSGPGLLSPTALLSEAARHASGDLAMSALIADTLATAPKGVLEGITRVEGRLDAGEVRRFDYVFVGGEIADVAVRARQRAAAGDFDVQVRDENGVIVAQDRGAVTGVAGRSAYVQWLPAHCAAFTVEIINVGTSASDFVLNAAPARQRACAR